MNKAIFKKIKGHKLNLLNKKNIKNGRMNIELNNTNNSKEFTNYPSISKIKSKSTNKLKTRIVNGMNKFPSIKLPQKKNNLNITNNIIKKENLTINTMKLKKHSHKEDSSKLRIKTNNSFILKNFHSTQNSNKLLLTKNRDSSYNLKKSQHYIKTKNNNNLISNPNMGITRHLDRKKMKENKSIILPKHNLKIFKENRIINNNLNKSRDKFKLKNNTFKKINNLFQFEQKENEFQNLFNRSNLKTEINEININEHKNEMKVIDIISNISLSEEELNFSEEDSIDNMEFSLEDEEI